MEPVVSIALGAVVATYERLALILSSLDFAIRSRVVHDVWFTL